jgi:hypothetical protein
MKFGCLYSKSLSNADHVQTYDYGDLLMRLRKWIRDDAMPWLDDQDAMYGCTNYGDMSMPPQGTFLP